MFNYKNRLFFLSIILFGILTIPFAGCHKNKAIGPFKKIVFITIDTLRPDHLKCYGYIRETSPFLSQLMEQGVKFENAFSASSHTAPSHSTMFTSLFPYEHKVLRNHDSMNSKLFHLHQVLNSLNYKQGIFTATKFLEGKVGFPTPEQEFRLKRFTGEAKVQYLMAEPNVNRAIKWLEQNNNPEQYFLWLHLYDVHEWAEENSPTLPMEYLNMFPKYGTPEAEALIDFVVSKHNIPLSFYNNDRQKYYESMTRYDARLRYIDDQLKRLADFIKSKGDDDILWIVTSDHGEGLGNHDYAGHGEFLYQEQLHVPLIFSANNKRLKTLAINDLVRTVDYLPTIIELTGAKISLEQKVQGISLVPLLTTGKWGEQKVAYSFAERRPKDSGTLRGPWESGEIFSVHDLEEKHIHHTESSNEYYDLKADPFEERNLGDHYSSLKPTFKRKTDELLKFFKGGARKLGEQNLNQSEIDELTTLGYM